LSAADVLREQVKAIRNSRKNASRHLEQLKVAMEKQSSKGKEFVKEWQSNFVAGNGNEDLEGEEEDD